MRIKNKYQKLLAAAGMLIILAPGLFAFSPKKAEASFGRMGASMTSASLPTVPTSDAPQLLKVGWLDQIAYMLIKAVLRQLTTSIVNWIKTGFNGQPTFITDFGGFMKNSADEATGVFMANVLNPGFYQMICSPFRLQLMLSLPFYRYYKPQCTLNTILSVQGQSFESFSKSFRNGGWSAWISMTQNSNNNYYGAFFNTWDAYLAKLAAAQNKSQTEATYGKGFIGIKKCASYNSSGPDDPNPVCSKWVTQSPGAWVEDQLAAVTTSDIRTMELANNFNEIISALISTLLTYAVTGGSSNGLLGSSPPALPDTTPVRNEIISKINTTLLPANLILGEASSTVQVLSQATSTYAKARDCYAASNPALAASIDGKIQTINNSDYPPAKQLFAAAKDLKLKLEILRDGVPAADSPGFLEAAQILITESDTLNQKLIDLQLSQFNVIKPDDAKAKLDDAKTALATCGG
jgi:hypothetical protein